MKIASEKTFNVFGFLQEIIYNGKIGNTLNTWGDKNN